MNVPVLARTFETAGLSTILVSQIPYLVETVGAPRTLAVEFPLATTLGQPHNKDQQKRVLIQALEVLETSKEPGTVEHSKETWPVPQKEALKDWQPKEPSPLIKALAPHFLELARRQRRSKNRDSGGQNIQE